MTPWTAACQASLSFTISLSLLKLIPIELVMPSNHLTLSPTSPLALNLSQHQDPFQWVSNSHQVTKILKLQLQYQPFFFQCESESHSVRFHSLWPQGLSSSWNSSGQNFGVGSLSLLQGIFLTQGSNLGLLHHRWILYQLRHKGSPSGYPIPSQLIFLTQESNWCLLDFRQILYQLSYQGSPSFLFGQP